MNGFSDIDIIYLFTTALVFVILVIMMVIYMVFYKKKSALLLERKTKETQFQQEITLAIIEMKETTLSYIGQELHDDLGQKMSIAKLMVNLGLENAEGEQREILLEINEVIGESIRDIRNLSKSFISEQIENLDLIEAIQKEVTRVDRLNLMKIVFSHNVDKISVDSKDSLILFRVIQESINNVLKHSRAKNLLISLHDVGSEVEIILQDDGIGFEKNHDKTGSGLNSMKKRANLIKADFNLVTEVGKGTTISIKYHKK